MLRTLDTRRPLRGYLIECRGIIRIRSVSFRYKKSIIPAALSFLCCVFFSCPFVVPAGDEKEQAAVRWLIYYSRAFRWISIVCWVTSSITPIRLSPPFWLGSSSAVVMRWNGKKESVVKHTYQIILFGILTQVDEAAKELVGGGGDQQLISPSRSTDRRVRKWQLKAPWAGRAASWSLCGGVARV